MTSSDRQDLSGQVVGANLTWHERNIRRREKATADGGQEPLSLELDVNGGVQEARDGKSPAIWVRQRAQSAGGTVDGTFDVTVLFRMQEDFPVSDDELVEEFIRVIGFDYVLGFVRGAFADGAQSLGLRPYLIPVIDPAGEFLEQIENDGPSEEESGDK